MAFLYPAFLVGALAIALPIVLHLLRRDAAPDVPFSAVRLLHRSPIERSRRRRLRDILLLAARIAALMLLATAFARPYLTGATAGSTLRIVAVDRSFSMGTPDRFSHALSLARAAIDEASAGDRVCLIAFDDRAEVIAAPAGPGNARAALTALKPGFGATRFAPVIAQALEIAAGDPVRVIMITDLQRNGWEDEQPLTVPAGMQVEVRDAGAPPPNAAVTQVRVEADRVIASVANSSRSAVEGVARIRIDGRELASAPFRAPADGTIDVQIPYRSGNRGALAVAIDDPQGYPADNVRFALLDPPAATHVLLAADAAAAQPGLYFSRALEAAQEHAIDVRPVSGAEIATLSAAAAKEPIVLTVLSTRGLNGRARENTAAFVRDGGGLLVFAGNDVEPAVIASLAGAPDLRASARQETLTLSLSDVRHPVFRPFGPLAANLGQIRFDRSWRVVANGWDVAARFTDGSPALLEREVDRGRVLLFASDVDRQWNDFPLHPAFVPFVVEAVRHAARSATREREYLVGNAPAGVPRDPGIHQTPGGRTVAVNVDPRESGAARLTPGEFADMLTPTSEAAPPGRQASGARHAEARQSLWQYGLVLMLVVLVVESVIGRG
jgi:hypothetical protein